MKKLIIGTAQLGSKYGIANYSDKLSKKKLFQFLEFCYNNSLVSFDTASDYNSENILGEFIKKNNIQNISISTKIPSLKYVSKKNKLNFVREVIDSSLNKLNINNLDTVFFHDENDIDFYQSNEFDIVNIFKEYNIKNLGFSIYSKKIFNRLNKNKNVQSFQLPINIVNNDFLKIKSNKKIIARSIFLQGILISSKINTKNKILKNFNHKLIDFANEQKINLYALCVNYILKKKEINKFTVGFDNISQLKELLRLKKYYKKIDRDIKLINKLITKDNYKKIIDPRKW